MPADCGLPVATLALRRPVEVEREAILEVVAGTRPKHRIAATGEAAPPGGDARRGRESPAQPESATPFVEVDVVGEEPARGVMSVHAHGHAPGQLAAQLQTTLVGATIQLGLPPVDLVSPAARQRNAGAGG